MFAESTSRAAYRSVPMRLRQIYMPLATVMDRVLRASGAIMYNKDRMRTLPRIIVAW